MKTKITAIFLAIIFMFSLSMNVLAFETEASEMTVTNVEGNYFYSVITLDNGVRGYCVQMQMPHPVEGVVYSETDFSVSGLDEIFVAISLLDNGDEDFAIAAGFAVWEKSEGFPMVDACASMATPEAADYCAAILELANNLNEDFIVEYKYYKADGYQIIVVPTIVETFPVETDPVETEPVETEPVETEPVETEPVETEPVETEPVETEPVETEPVETEPVETEPVETEPVETEPVETEPVETEPVETEPVETEPVETEPVETEPVETEPVETDPVVTDPFDEPDDLGFEVEVAPQTGDMSNVTVFVFLMIASALAIVVVLMSGKRKENN